MLLKKPPKLNLKINKEDQHLRNGVNLDSSSYLVESKLGEGSYGSVFLVLHHDLKKKVGLKIIQSSNEDDHV